MKNLKTLKKINFSKLIKISDTPHAISLGFSIGVFVSFTPLIGIHIIIALVISWMIRANYFSAIIGTFIGTPFTYPFIWFASIYVGNFFMPIKDLNLLTLDVKQLYLFDFFDNMKSLFPSFLIGAFLLGVLSSIFSYFFTKQIISFYRKKRQKKVGVINE